MTRLARSGGRFVLEGLPYDRRDLAKAAGFAWDGRRKVWWTDDDGTARELVRFADPPTAHRLALDLRRPEGVRWVHAGQGSTVAELAQAFGLRSPMLEAEPEGKQTRLELTGRPLTEVDRIVYLEAVILRETVRSRKAADVEKALRIIARKRKAKLGPLRLTEAQAERALGLLPQYRALLPAELAARLLG